MYAIWLLFTKEDTKYLKEIIKEFSNRFDSSIFVPHITIYGLINLDKKLIETAIKKVIQNTKLISIKKSKIKESDNIWKTLFIEIEMNEKLNFINENIKTELSGLPKYNFSPHISLLYKKIKKENRISCIKDLETKDEFKIDKIAILKFSDNVEEWKIIKTIKF